MILFCEGFDKYGGLNSTGTVNTLLQTGDWTSAINPLWIVAPLSASGFALSVPNNSTLTRTLAGNYSRIIGGTRFNSTIVSAVAGGITFADAGASQFSITIGTTGQIAIRSGGVTGGIIATSAAAVAANSTHYLEWDVTIGAAGAYQLYLDGVALFTAGSTGNTRGGTSNNYINGMSLSASGGGGSTCTFDDMYLFDSTGTRNNAPLLTSPRVETSFATADAGVQMTLGAAVLGSTISRQAGLIGTGTNWMYLRSFTPAINCTLNSISIPPVNSGTSNYKPAVYADASGVPGSLMSGGAGVGPGPTSGTLLVLPLTTPQTLVAGTRYWLGFITDVGIGNVFSTADAGTNGLTFNSTYSSGPPATAPTGASAGNVLLWGNITGALGHYYAVNQQPPPVANQSYVYDTVVGDEDFYSMPNLSGTTTNVYAVAVKAFCERSDTGARTVSMRMKSAGVDGAGSLAGQTPGTSYGWLGSYFETDPNTSAPWTPAAVNAATAGYRIDS